MSKRTASTSLMSLAQAADFLHVGARTQPAALGMRLRVDPADQSHCRAAMAPGAAGTAAPGECRLELGDRLAVGFDRPGIDADDILVVRRGDRTVWPPRSPGPVQVLLFDSP
jgi:hypothetical protein